MKNLLILITFLTCNQVFCQEIYSGVFQQTEAKLLYREAINWDVLTGTNDSLASAGYRLIDLESYRSGKERLFTGIWSESNLKSEIESVLGWPEFIKRKRARASDGYLMDEIESYAVSEEEFYYIGVWYKSPTIHKVWKLDSQEGIKQKTEEMAKQEFFLIDVEAINTPGKVIQFLALYHKGEVNEPRSYVFVSNSLKIFNTDLLQRTKSGYRLLDYEKFEEAGESFYLGVYRRGDYETVLLRDQDKESFNALWEGKEKEGLRLVDLEINLLPKATQ
ncbi:MAG: hypothetical protein DHS20C18_23170 [Saprospiraceae bacterium]|nr:MAG: hypothetical protein DHS20C18_23170 [Saprospiraceae bacterium]